MMYLNDVNYGILKGWLKAMARINDKTDHGHYFSLDRFEKAAEFKADVDKHFFSISEKITYERISNPKDFLVEHVYKWFYGFQKDDLLQSYYLDDVKQHFSLSDPDWKKEWIEEFAELLLETIKPDMVCKILLGNTKGYYANMSDDIILESKTSYFHLHFSLTD